MRSKFIQMCTILIFFISAILLSGCIVKPAANHRHHKANVVKPVKVVMSLDDEHNSQKIVIVTVKPESKRNCRAHKNHWHCSH